MNSPAPQEVAVRIDGVVKGFGQGNTRVMALKGATLEARCGEMLMIVGPSGCGKTTLLSVICGTLAFDEGRVEVFGKDLESLSTAEVTRFRSANVGFIFQQFNLIPTLDAVENASIPLILQGYAPRAAERRAAEVLSSIDMGSRLRAYPAQLSGGQQQRVAISRALVHDPRLVICDEPTASLDAATGQKTLAILKEIARRPDRCVIVVTHDSRIFHFADRIAEIEDGRVRGIHKASDLQHS